MLHRSRISAVARTVLFALLFAQAAIAAAACEMQERAPAQAFAAQESMPCHDEPAPNANLCLAHCTSADQSADTPQVAMPVWSAPVLLVVVPFDRSCDRVAFLQHPRPVPAGPPPRILFQSFLI